MSTPSLSAPLSERIRYSPDAVSQDELLAALARLDHLENLLGDADLDPDASTSLSEQVDARIDASIAKQCPDHEAYAEFFRDCFNALASEYPCAEVTSGHDCRVIIDTIAAADERRDVLVDAQDRLKELRALLRAAHSTVLNHSTTHPDVLHGVTDALDAAAALNAMLATLDLP